MSTELEDNDLKKYISFCKHFQRFNSPVLRFKHIPEEYKNQYKIKYHVDEEEVCKATFFISFNSFSKYQEYEISFVFNGTDFLKNSILSLNISVIQEPDNKKPFEPNLVLPVSIGIIIVSVLSIIFYMKKKRSL